MIPLEIKKKTHIFVANTMYVRFLRLMKIP